MSSTINEMLDAGAEAPEDDGRDEYTGHVAACRGGAADCTCPRKLTPEERNTVIEEVAAECDQMRIAGQKYHWLGAFWTYFNDPYPKRAEVAAFVRSLKTSKPSCRS